MKKTVTISFLAVFSLLLAQCTPKTSSNMASTNATAEKKVADIKQKYTQQQIDEGKTISINSCNKCHQYHEPQEFSVAKWERVLTQMIPKAKLNETDGGMVSAYILTHAKLN